MYWLSNKIQSEQLLQPGDHIYTWRLGYLYSHHGIYVGEGKVIHLTRGPGLIIFSTSPSHPSGDRVVCCSMEQFLCGGELYRYEYGVKRALLPFKRGGTCTLYPSDPTEDVLHRASTLLVKGFGDYDLLQNNCEDFAIYCKTGFLRVDIDQPAKSGQFDTFLCIIFVVIFFPYHMLPRGGLVSALVVCGLFSYFKLRVDIDIEKVPVEIFDLGHQRALRREKDTTRWSLPALSYVYYAYLGLSYWSWTPVGTIFSWIRFTVLHTLFVTFAHQHLKNHSFKIGESMAYIIWVLHIGTGVQRVKFSCGPDYG